MLTAPRGRHRARYALPRLVATLLVAVLATPAHAGPLAEPGGLPCRADGFYTVAAMFWNEPNVRIGAVTGGPWRAPGATRISMLCELVPAADPDGGYVQLRVANTSQGEVATLFSGMRHWFNIGDPPLICTTVTWSGPAGDGRWPVSGRSCVPSAEYPFP